MPVEGPHSVQSPLMQNWAKITFLAGCFSPALQEDGVKQVEFQRARAPALLSRGQPGSEPSPNCRVTNDNHPPYIIHPGLHLNTRSDRAS